MRVKTKKRLLSVQQGHRYPTLIVLLMTGLVVFCAACSAEGGLEQQRQEIEAEGEAFLDRVDQLPQSDLQLLLRMKGQEAYFMGLMNVGADDLIDGPRYEDSPNSVISDYDTVSEMHQNYMRGIILDVNPSTPDLVVVREPFEYPFHHTFNWESVQFEDGTTLDLGKPAQQLNPQPIVMSGNRGFKFNWGTEAAQKAVQLTGSVNIEFPDNEGILSFSRSDKNQWRDLGGMRIRLAEIGQHNVRFEVQNSDAQKPMLDEEDFIIGATDKTGEYLQFVGSQSGSDHEIEVVIKAINLGLEEALAGNIPPTISEAELDQILADLVADERKPVVYTLEVFFNGDIETVNLLFTPRADPKRFDVSLEAVDFSSPDARDVPIRDILTDAVAFDHARTTLIDRALKAERFDLLGDQARRAVTHNATRDGMGIIRIGFDYATLPSELFLPRESRFGSWDEEYAVEVFDELGQPLEPGYTSSRFLNGDLEIDSEAYERTPYRAKGFVTLKTAPDMNVEIVAKADLPDGISIHDNQVRLDSDFIDQDIKVFALDERGRALQAIEDILYPRPNLYERVIYYYGEPTAVAVFRQGELQETRHEFDISLDESINFPGARTE